MNILKILCFYGTRFWTATVLQTKEIKYLKTMRTKIIFLLLIFISIELTLSAQTNNRINIEFKDEALSTALKKLEKNFGLSHPFYI